MPRLPLLFGLIAAGVAAAGIVAAVRRRKKESGAEPPPGYKPEEWGTVEEASHESFPASDPPSFTPGHT